MFLFKFDGFGIFYLFIEFLLLLLCEALVFDAVTQEFGGVFDHGEGAKVRRNMGDGLFVCEVGGRVFVLTAKERIGVSLNEFNRRSCEANLIGVKPTEKIAIAVVDTSVAFIRDNEIEKSWIKILEALHHRGVGGEVDALGAIF